MKKLIIPLFLILTIFIGTTVTVSAAPPPSYIYCEDIGYDYVISMSINDSYDLTSYYPRGTKSISSCTYNSDVVDVEYYSGRYYIEPYNCGITEVYIDCYDRNDFYLETISFIVAVFSSQDIRNTTTIYNSYFPQSSYSSRYKADSAYIDDPYVDCETSKYSDDFVYYNYFIQLYGDIYVDEMGFYDTYVTGYSDVACISVAPDGSYNIALTDVTVKLVWWQWLIKILLFGWIWY